MYVLEVPRASGTVNNFSDIIASLGGTVISIVPFQKGTSFQYVIIYRAVKNLTKSIHNTFYEVGESDADN